MQACMCIYSVFSLGSIGGCLSKVIQGKTASTPDIVERDIAWFNGNQRLQSSKNCLQTDHTLFLFYSCFLGNYEKMVNHIKPYDWFLKLRIGIVLIWQLPRKKKLKNIWEMSKEARTLFHGL